MTSTGYLVQGWQVDPNTQAIRKDLVTPLRILQPKNLTSEPEFTTQANVSGVLDKNDKNVKSDDGYLMSLTVYDNLGYSYTAMFAVKDFDADNGKYTVDLKGVYDSDNVDILDDYLDNNTTSDAERKAAIATIFGKDGGTAVDRRAAATTYTIDDGKISYISGGKEYFHTLPLASSDFTGTPPSILFKDSDGNVDPNDTDGKSVTDIWGVSQATLDAYGAYTLTANTKGELQIEYGAINYPMEFNTQDGTFSFIEDDGTVAVPFNLNVIKDSFSTINVDFSKCLNYNNGGASTLGMDRGTTVDPTDGAGKKLGVLTGVSVSKNGEIFGSYDNGNTVLLGQIAVAQFANASGLEALGNNVYGQTLNSGEFDGVGVDVTADGGSMSTGQLEMSNVDLSSEFTEMITTQRGFQANSRIITVSDTLLEELTNLKR